MQAHLRRAVEFVLAAAIVGVVGVLAYVPLALQGGWAPLALGVTTAQEAFLAPAVALTSLVVLVATYLSDRWISVAWLRIAVMTLVLALLTGALSYFAWQVGA
jgi:hypothetical protein